MSIMQPSLTVRQMEAGDIPHIVGYWQHNDPAFLAGMGVDLAKVPPPEKLTAFLTGQLALPIPQRESFCLIWCVDGEPVGHNNINKITFGEEAYMHLHLWQITSRRKGMGPEFVKKAVPHFFHHMELKKLVSEPYSLNPAPNRVLEKAGFRFVREYITVPGSLNFEQPVNRWELTAEQVAGW